MAVRDHVNRDPRMRSYITLVDTAQGFIECVAKDGQVRRISVQGSGPALFRWPVEGEEWMIAERNGTWYLGNKISIDLEFPLIDSSQLDPGNYALELSPENQIVVYDQPSPLDGNRTRHTVARKYSEVIGDGATTTFLIYHMLQARAVVISINSLVAPREPVSLDVVTDIQDDWIQLDFGVTPATNELVVTVIG